ncbi:hypothetical protein [Burkholderia ubonensis]|uniref:hypothetical protein n=1 Tax=Burkholderia ubonensis TaxID=101571 RepID=UPI000A9515CC|nr:hypothetical protein [Burkholderia ubonensis]
MGLVVIFIYLFLCLLVGKWASASGRSFGLWFLLSVLIDPILAAILLVVAAK